VAIVSGALWFASVVATMADSPAAALDPASLRMVLLDTDFGRLWSARAVLAAILLVCTIGISVFRRSAPRSLLIAGAAALLLASLALTGHTQTQEGGTRWLQEGSDGLHLLAAGAWLGGLVPLAIVSREDAPEQAASALVRFSGMGYAAVATLLATGIFNSWLLVGTIDGLVRTSYGLLLLSKVGVFAIMTALAGINRLLLVPVLDSASGRGGALGRLRRHIALEQALGFAAIAIVSVLGTLAPPTAS
jgi:putative copper resistance protein D